MAARSPTFRGTGPGGEPRARGLGGVERRRSSARRPSGLTVLPDGRLLRDAIDGRPGRVARRRARRRLRLRPGAAGQAARRRPAPAGARPPRRAVRGRAPGARARQDRGVGGARARPGAPGLHAGRRRRRAGRLGADAGHGRDARRDARARPRRRRRRAGPRRAAARDRAGRVRRRAPGADRPVDPAGVVRVRRSTAPPTVTWASGSTSRSRPWTAAGGRADEIARLRGATAASSGDLLPDAAAFFRVERWTGARVLDAGLAVLVVVAGDGSLVADGCRRRVRRGQTVLLPAAVGPVTVEGDEPAGGRLPPAASVDRWARPAMRLTRSVERWTARARLRADVKVNNEVRPRDGTRCSAHDAHG